MMTVARPIAYSDTRNVDLDYDTFTVVNNWIMRPAGFAYLVGAWTKQLTAPEY
jgi:hypothetical protein